MVITGGDSLESLSSIDSARNVISYLDRDIFNCSLLKVENWNWSLLASDIIEDKQLSYSEIDVSDLSINFKAKKIKFDVAFIAIHGAPAETGYLQAYLEMVGIPYTGSGVLTSALTMNKLFCKEIVRVVKNVKVPSGKIFDKADLKGKKYPCIVKPNSYGSGIGVSVVNNKQSLEISVKKIQQLKQDALIEEYIEGREVTVGAVILENNIHVLPVAETLRADQKKLLTKNKFYNYTNRQSAEIVIEPSIDAKLVRKLQNVTKKIGELLGCRSFYRVDYMLSKKNEIYFLEVNTIPGMTARSVFVKQIERTGLKQGDIYKRLIMEAMRAQKS